MKSMRTTETAAGLGSPALAVRLREMGVVGAGGAGFPAGVKASSRVEYVLANGAECEPLVHKDVELMKRHPEEIVAGMSLMMEATGATRGKFGIKEKNQAAVNAIKAQLDRRPIDVVLLGDFYPSGDEYELVHSATGRLIPPAGIPLQVGCVVNNVETLYNVHQAAQDQPVTRKFVSVSGAVRQPKAFWTPVGTPLSDLIAAAGGATVPDYVVFVSGIMMGSLATDLDSPVMKTTAGLIVLPRSHYLVERRSRPEKVQLHIGKSACDQCSYCTEFCPRYLLGYDVRPHQVMRSLGFTKTGEQQWNQWGQLCCACGICTLYACPEDLYPKEACDKAKRDFRAAGLKMEQMQPPRVHPMKEFRRIPLAMLRRKLKVEEFESDTPFDGTAIEPARVRVRLLHGVGKPAAPVVAQGDHVRCGQTIARIAEGQLGTDVHASIEGAVAAVTESWIEIVR